MSDVREAVRARYGAIARSAGEASATDEATDGTSCCSTSCCSSDSTRDRAARLGYDAEDLASIPAGANLGLGCGNPVGIAGLRPGQTVLDLGSGAGIDCFLAAARVGRTGRVIGVDMTPDMLERARAHAREGGHDNVEFRLGEIEHLPLADGSVDVVLSNCVVNLSPDKAAVYREAWRVLAPGGRLVIADIVASAPIPEAVQADLALHVGCIAGAVTVDATRTMLAAAGFEEVTIVTNDESRAFIRTWAPDRGLEQFIVSATIEATRP